MQQSSVSTKSEVFLSFHSRSDAVFSFSVTGVLVFSQESDIMQPQVDAERNSLQTSTVNLCEGKNKLKYIHLCDAFKQHDEKKTLK